MSCTAIVSVVVVVVVLFSLSWTTPSHLSNTTVRYRALTLTSTILRCLLGQAVTVHLSLRVCAVRTSMSHFPPPPGGTSPRGGGVDPGAIAPTVPHDLTALLFVSPVSFLSHSCTALQ